MRPPALLVDYGMVMSTAQPDHMVREMASLAGMKQPVFVERYWQHRPAYDRGSASRAYWSAVIGTEVSDEQLLDELSRLDVESWSHLNPEALQVFEAAHGRGSSLSLLSNAPYDLAATLSEHPVLGDFEHLMFSSRMGIVKPGRAIFDAAVDRLHRRAEEVVFIDDRAANVEAAVKAGMRGVLFTSAEQLRSELFGRNG